MILHPAFLTRDSSPGAGKPKWKLTTSGLRSSTAAQVNSVKRKIVALSGGVGISAPSSL
jgi:hypothetical protein